MIPRIQFAGNIGREFTVIVNNHYSVLLIDGSLLYGRLLFLVIDIFWIEMRVSRREGDNDARSRGSIGSVFSFYLASMELHDVQREIQSDSRSAQFAVARVSSLIESFEETFGVLVAKARATVNDAYFHLSAILGNPYSYFSAIKRMLKGVGDDVGEHFVEVVAVDPSHHLLFRRHDIQINSSLLGGIVKREADALDKRNKICFLTFQAHLFLVYLPHIENLVHEQ